MAVAGVAALTLTGTAAAAAPDVNSSESRLLELVNGHRASHGLAPLAAEGGLQAAARLQSERMAGAGILVHSVRLEALAGPIVPTWSRLGENVASGSDADAILAGLVGSPSHHGVIDGAFDVIGIGGAVGSDGTLYLTQLFALTTPRPSPTVSTTPRPSPAVSAPAPPSAAAIAPAAKVATPGSAAAKRAAARRAAAKRAAARHAAAHARR
ncbi:MAG: CAP domain-containing protein [Acidimicrobiales bacterium]